MKQKLIILTFFCLATFGLYAQKSAIPKGSSIVKGSIGFSSAKQTLEAKNLPVTYQFNTPTSKINIINLGAEYNILLARSVYLGIAGFLRSYKLKTEHNSRDIRVTNESLEIGPNFGLLAGNTEGKAHLMAYVNMSPRFLSLLNNYQGYSIVFGFGVLGRVKEYIAIDLSCNAHVQTIFGSQANGYFGGFGNSYNLKGTMLDINIGITGLLSKK